MPCLPSARSLSFFAVVVVAFLTVISIAAMQERDLMATVPLGLEQARNAAGLLVTVAGSFGLLYRAVEGAPLSHLLAMAMVVLAGAVVASPSWESCTGLGVLAVAAVLVAWKTPQSDWFAGICRLRTAPPAGSVGATKNSGNGVWMVPEQAGKTALSGTAVKPRLAAKTPIALGVAPVTVQLSLQPSAPVLVVLMVACVPPP